MITKIITTVEVSINGKIFWKILEIRKIEKIRLMVSLKLYAAVDADQTCFKENPNINLKPETFAHTSSNLLIPLINTSDDAL